MIDRKLIDILLNNNGVSIMNLEGSYLMRNKKGKLYYNSKEKIKFKNKDGKEMELTPTYIKLYNAKMPLSLETYRAFNLIPNEIYDKSDNKLINIEDYDKKGQELYTKLFINFKFEKNKVEFDEDGNKKVTKKNNIRKEIYTNDITVDGIKYSFFKRGGSKARTAQVIFVKSEYKDEILNPCLLGLKFEKDKEYDLTSKEAYTSLIMSSVIDIIHINRESILMINDINSEPFKAKQSLTVMREDGSVAQEEGLYDVINCTTDGQGLMDESIYEDNEILNESTCALLRNDFLKCNACRTKLQQYYRENNITKVWDMYRGWIDASKIKLVITPNSCKYLKFKDQFNSEKDCFLDWLNRIPEEFGVVKVDHIGNYGYSNRLSYQMINSMNLSKEEVKELMKYELDYIKLLKDNTLVTKEDIKQDRKKYTKEVKEEANKMEYFLNTLVSSSDELSTGDMLSALINKNSNYRFTKEFKEYKNNTIKQYISNLRTGAIRIKNSLYSIMISCPYEMLTSTHTENNKVENWITNKQECFNSYFEDDVDLISIRNPQINAGNIYWMKNKYRKEYKWFGYQKDGVHKHDFVVFVNTNGVDLMNRLQGADFDIDTTFLCDNSLLIKKAKENSLYYTPTNGISGSKELRKFNNESLSKLDNYLGKSTQYIGMIVNKSAIFNAYMYDAIKKNKPKEYIQSCYNASSTLSSYSQIAIDMAKQSFTDNKGDSLNLISMMAELNNTSYNGDKILKYKIDTDRVDTVKLKDVIKDIIHNDKFENRKYIPLKKINELIIEQYKKDLRNYNKLTDEEKRVCNLIKKYETKIEVHSRKMVAPLFFKYVAQDNSTRKLEKMECGMDYLEEILDELDTKCIKTDKIKVEDLIETKRYINTNGKINYDKIDNVRKIIDNCNSNLIIIYKDLNNNESLFNLIKFHKKKTIEQLKELKMNKLTIYEIMIRMFGIEKGYKGKEVLITFKNGKNKNIKEFKDMKSNTMSLIYNSYPKYFLECFKESKLKDDLEEKIYWN